MNTGNRSASYNVFDFPGNAALFEGVLSRRLMAFTIDFAMIGFMALAVLFFLFILGIATFSLLWLIIPLVLPPIVVAIVLVYVAFTAGGKYSATPGMRTVGLELRMLDGRKMYPMMAVFHALSFYFLSTVLTPFIILVGLITSQHRLLHDYVSGAVVLNREALPQELSFR